MTSFNKAEKIDELAKTELQHLLKIVNSDINALNVSSLKNVVKAIAQVTVAEEMLEQGSAVLNEREMLLIDRIFKLQETVLGIITLEAQKEN